MDYNVRNRSGGMVVYTIPEEGIRREFMPGETKVITKDELDKLSFQAGGRELMESFLQIQSAEFLEELNIKAEPEYFMSEQEIADLIIGGSQEAFLDCLDFAPQGVIDILKKLAIAIPMRDMMKIEALKNKTGFDVAKALEVKKLDEIEEGEPAVPEQKQRRVAVKEEGKKERRAEAPKYKVVEKEE